MSNLISNSGHLRSHGGHLANDSNGTDCCCPEGCPTDCSECASSFTLTISGAINGGEGYLCCCAINGIYDILREADQCLWNVTTDLDASCCGPGPTIPFVVGIHCSTTDCNGNPGARRWVITAGGSFTFWAEIISDAACPPTGSYNVISMCEDCGSVPGTGLTVTLS